MKHLKIFVRISNLKMGSLDSLPLKELSELIKDELPIIHTIQFVPVIASSLVLPYKDFYIEVSQISDEYPDFPIQIDSILSRVKYHLQCSLSYRVVPSDK